jgi:hypothetical protein
MFITSENKSYLRNSFKDRATLGSVQNAHFIAGLASKKLFAFKRIQTLDLTKMLSKPLSLIFTALN